MLELGKIQLDRAASRHGRLATHRARRLVAAVAAIAVLAAIAGGTANEARAGYAYWSVNGYGNYAAMANLSVQCKTTYWANGTKTWEIRVSGSKLFADRYRVWTRYYSNWGISSNGNWISLQTLSKTLYSWRRVVAGSQAKNTVSFWSDFYLEKLYHPAVRAEHETLSVVASRWHDGSISYNTFSHGKGDSCTLL